MSKRLIYAEDAIEALSESLKGVFVAYEDIAKKTIDKVPSAQPYSLDEWCDTCKEYDHETHSCPRFNRVIRETLDDVRKDAYKHGKSKGIKKGRAMAQMIKGRWIQDNYYNEKYVCDKCGEPCATYINGKPRDRFCKWCGAEMRGDEE